MDNASIIATFPADLREEVCIFNFVTRQLYLINSGKAPFDGQLLDVYFTRSFYKHILGVKVTYHDIEAVDSGY
nr:E3 ubiquitin-protein ligase UPL1 isoform X1 [Tanacetum cinerariifolium]